MFALDPTAQLDTGPDGTARAMAEMLVLMAFHHGASRLEYRTIDGEFRVAEIIADRAYEYPQPPECIRIPTIQHLKSMFSLSQGWNGSGAELGIGSSRAAASCVIEESEMDATITVVRDFTPATDLTQPMDRFWRSCAARRGLLALLAYHARRLVWRVEDSANHRLQRSGGGRRFGNG